MSTIVAGWFDHIVPAEQAIEALRRIGIAQDKVSKLHLNASGQHARLPAGGDEVADKGTTEAVGGSVLGAGLGAVAVAAVATAIAPPLGIAAGAAVGAYTGSLVGALASMQDSNEADATSDIPPRKAGIMVAVNADAGAGLDAITSLLEERGAEAVEVSEGVWEQGVWRDFDPTSTPNLVT